MRETATFHTGPDGSLVLAVDPGDGAAFDYDDIEVETSGKTIHVTAPDAGPLDLEAVHGRVED
jgi:hypothetical protein